MLPLLQVFGAPTSSVEQAEGKLCLLVGLVGLGIGIWMNKNHDSRRMIVKSTGSLPDCSVLNTRVVGKERQSNGQTEEIPLRS